MPTQLVHAKEKATLMTTSECNTSEKIGGIKFKIPSF
jgi:hypothetical protein